MKKNFTKKWSAFLPYLFVMISICYLSYLLVYQASFLPNSYEIVSSQKDGLTIRSFNIIGMEEKTQTISFSENEKWKIEEIGYQVERQKEFLWLLFSAIGVSSTRIVMYVRNGVKFWKAVLKSNLIFAILLPLIILMSTWKMIKLWIS